MSSRTIGIIAFVLLAAYSAILFAFELTISQEYARHYFTDFVGPVLFYGINTVLCTFFLWATALLFFLSLRFAQPAPTGREFLFLWSQVLFFAFLGIDERFLIHERLGMRTGINDAYILLALGVGELLCLYFLGDFFRRSRSSQKFVITAGVLFAIMVAVDAKMPSAWRPRLALEDLSKFWAIFFLFLFGLEELTRKIASRSHTSLPPRETR